MLEVTSESGAGVTPASTTGDIGAGVRPGPGKRIMWAASRDVENLQINQFKFNIRASAGAGLPVATGRLTVSTTPPGATVFVDGTNRGFTPLTVTELTAGSHSLLVVREGFDESRRSVDITAGAAETVTVALTPAAAAATTAVASQGGAAAQTPAVSSSSGGGKKLLWIGLGVAGAGGAAVALKGGKPPTRVETLTETCGNGIDDNRNGQIDENPPCTPPPLATCTFTVTGLANVTVPAAAGTVSRPQVREQNAPCTGGSWSSSTTASWLTVAPDRGTSAGEVSVTAQANTSGIRSATLIIAGVTAQVAQDALSCSFRANFAGGDGVPPNSTNTVVPGDCEGSGCGTRTVSVEATGSACAWSIDGPPSWFAEIDRPAPGSRSIRFQVYERNTTGRDRSASFRVAGVNFTVTQCAARCP